MSRYSYSNITIVTDVAVLEFLYALFVHPGYPRLIILFFFLQKLEHKYITKFKLFLTTMTSELSEYLNEQLGVLLNVFFKCKSMKK